MRTDRFVRASVVFVAAAALLLVANSAFATAEDDFQSGNAMLAKGDFEGATKAYATAAKADPQNMAYRKQFAMMRQVVRMRQSLEREENIEKWNGTADALRAFYLENGILTEALALDESRYEKQHDAQAAALLAESQLALDRNDEALTTLAAVGGADQTAQTQTLMSLALARAGEIEKAKSVLAEVSKPEDATARMLTNMARAHALVGDADAAVSLLAAAFEQTPPSKLEAAKAEAKESTDFASLAETTKFSVALATESKVKESGCSGGSSCGSCPSKGGCSSKSSGSSCSK